MPEPAHLVGLIDGGWRDLPSSRFAMASTSAVWSLASRKWRCCATSPAPACRGTIHRGLETVLVLEGAQSDENGTYEDRNAGGQSASDRSTAFPPTSAASSSSSGPGRSKSSSLRNVVVSLDTLPFTFSALRDAYRGGVAPEAVIAEVFRRLEAADDPAIFIHPDRRGGARRGTRRSAPTTTPGRSGACPLRSRTISTSRACRQRPPVPTLPMRRAKTRLSSARLRLAGAIPVGKTNLDQFATGLVGVRSPYGVPRNALDPDARAGRFELRFGRGGGARHRRFRPRHRHRRFGPRAGRAKQHRRAEAEPGRPVGDGA